MTSSIEWTVGDSQGLVSIGTHSLYLRAAGPVRSLDTPVVICVTGIGGASVSWSAVLRHVSAFARVYSYDRAGLGNSGLPADFTLESKSYVNIAKELRSLLDIAGIKPPYLLVMHSMAGIPGREFLHLYPETVAGMVFVDTVTEENYKTRPEKLPQTMHDLWGDMDMSFLWTERKPVFTTEEWREVAESEGLGGEAPSEEKRHTLERAIKSEVANLIPSSKVLAERKQLDATPLGDKPVSVIKGDEPGEWRKCFQEAIAAGRGTEEQRKLVSDSLDGADAQRLWLQFKQLRLSSNSRLVEARASWHDVHWYQPDLVAREIKWCLEQFAKTQSD